MNMTTEKLPDYLLDPPECAPTPDEIFFDDIKERMEEIENLIEYLKRYPAGNMRRSYMKNIKHTCRDIIEAVEKLEWSEV